MDKSEDNRRAASAADTSAALGIALDAARDSADLAEDARTLLREQARLARIQADQLHEEDLLARLSLRVRRTSEMMKLAFELSVALVLVAVLAALATAMWTAAHDNGLVIEAFSVPPDLTQRGLGGEVIASQLLDKLSRMQQETNSIRPADTYRNNWGDDIKVEIPDTGISIGELNRYLRHWLGHETHITGEIYRTPSGIAVTARATDAGQTFAGKETDLDSLLQKAAEAIYAETQPYRYAAYLNQVGRDGEALPVLRKLAADSSPSERSWALSLLGNLDLFYNHESDALATLRSAVEADPANAHAWDNLASGEQRLDHLGDGFRHTEKALQLYDSGAVALDPDRVAVIKLQDRAFLADSLGDHRAAAGFDEDMSRLPDRNGSHFSALNDEMAEAAYDHDFKRASEILSRLHPADVNQRLNFWFESATVAYLKRDWRGAERSLDSRTVFAVAPAVFRPVLQSIIRRNPGSLLADAKAEEGDLATARTLIGTTPLDCYTCLRMRGRIDAAAGNWNGAGFWFERAVDSAPLIPLAWNDWGAMLLRKGDLRDAISKFETAASTGPHYADPLELWGEALMRANRSDLAVAKFEAANRYAPNWGRNHLKWGEALVFLGRPADAQAQWNTASRLDLFPEERAELATMEHRRQL